MLVKMSVGSKPVTQHGILSLLTINLYISIPVIVLTWPGQISASMVEYGLRSKTFNALGRVLFKDSI